MPTAQKDYSKEIGLFLRFIEEGEEEEEEEE